MIQSLYCSPSMDTLISAVKLVLNIIRWAIHIVLIILGSIDMFKAMASNDDKKAGEAKSTFIRRLIYAVVAFLIPFLVGLAFELVGSILVNDGTDIHNENLTTNGFFECWYENSNSSKSNNDTANSDDDSEMCNCYDGNAREYIGVISEYECESSRGLICR